MKKHTLGYSVMAYCICFLLISCQKGNPDIPAEPKAIFTLVPPADDCSDIIINASFSTGVPTSDDSIQVKVNVSKIGTWSYRTDTINGISFEGSGTIKDTGLQYISVAPNGTPVLPGNFVHTFKSGTSQVNVYASVIDKNIIAEPVPGDTPYFKLTLDNITFHLTNDNNDPARQVGMWGASVDSGSVGCAIGPGTYPNPPGTGTISIQKNYLATSNPTLTADDFKNFFAPGAYRIAIKTCEGATTDGFIIFWGDSDGDTWTTLYGNKQEGSYFKIVGREDGYNSKGKYYVKVKMRFACKLYSYVTGRTKQLTDGEMVAYFVKYQ